MAKEKWDAYRFLTHAAGHCAWGSESADRPADQGDTDAYLLLLQARKGADD